MLELGGHTAIGIAVGPCPETQHRSWRTLYVWDQMFPEYALVAQLANARAVPSVFKECKVSRLQ